MTIAGLAVGATQGYIYLRVEYPHAARALATGPARGARTRLSRARPARQRARLRHHGAPRRRRVHLRRRDLDARKPRGPARRSARAAAVARHQGLVRPAHGRQQRGHARDRARDPGAGRGFLSRFRRRQIARHDSAAARRQCEARRTGGARLRAHRERARLRLRRRHGDRPAGARGADRRPARRLSTARAEFDTPLDYEALAAQDALLGHGGVVVFDDTVDMARMARYALEFCAIESCGKCTPCRIGSTRGVELVDRILASSNGSRAGDLALLDELCDTMANGSLCGLGGMTPFPVRSALKHFREDFREGSQMYAKNYHDLGTPAANGAARHARDRWRDGHGAGGHVHHARRGARGRRHPEAVRHGHAEGLRFLPRLPGRDRRAARAFRPRAPPKWPPA